MSIFSRATSPALSAGSLASGSPASGERACDSGVLERASLGLEQLVAALAEAPHPAVLDLGCVWQATVSFFTRAGCKLYTENLFSALDDTLHRTPSTAPPLPERFLPAVLQYAPEQFRGVLAWDVFDYLPEELVEPVAARLVELLAPGGGLLLVSHSRREEAVFHRFRVRDARTLELVSAPLALRVQRVYQNRALLNLFAACRSSRTFVGRDHLREFFFVK